MSLSFTKDVPCPYCGRLVRDVPFALTLTFSIEGGQALDDGEQDEAKRRIRSHECQS